MFDKEYIEELSDLLCKHDLTEIFLKDGEKEISIRKETTLSTAQQVVAAPVAVAETDAKSSEASKVKSKGKAITSPMVGTFYKASSPGAKPFVEVGQTISEGEVVCVIEAMKLMNEIEADTSGKIIEICVDDGQPVEFGQVLMYVE